MVYILASSLILARMFLCKKYVSVFVFLLCGCNSVIIPDAFVYKEVETDGFTLASWQKLTDCTAPVKFYIEGDGRAFNSSGLPTQNPTPHGKMIREVAFGDNSPNVVYLARPCQFVKDAKCEQKYWTTARFAPEVIRSEAQAIKKIAQDRPVILVGFSGGAQVAGLVAVQNPDITVHQLITIAGNLDHKSWTEYHHLPSLNESLDLADYKEKYRLFPQIHYVGTKDEIIPQSITLDFVRYSNVIPVKGAKHSDGWQNIYSQIWEKN